MNSQERGSCQNVHLVIALTASPVVSCYRHEKLIPS